MCISSVTDAIESVVKQTIGVSKNNLDNINKNSADIKMEEIIKTGTKCFIWFFLCSFA